MSSFDNFDKPFSNLNLDLTRKLASLKNIQSLTCLNIKFHSSIIKQRLDDIWENVICKWIY